MFLRAAQSQTSTEIRQQIIRRPMMFHVTGVQNEPDSFALELPCTCRKLSEGYAHTPCALLTNLIAEI